MTSAETSSQQPGPEVPMQEIKTEVQTDDAEPDPGESKGEPRSEVRCSPGGNTKLVRGSFTYISSGPIMMFGYSF